MKKLASLVIAVSMPLTAHAAARIVSQSSIGASIPFQRNGSRVCYALSVPKESAANVDHRAGGERGGNEPEAIPRIRVEEWFDGRGFDRRARFKMFVKGNSAWLSDAALEPEFVDALRSGSQLTLHATSARGTRTTYAYSLTGVTAALERIAQCK